MSIALPVLQEVLGTLSTAEQLWWSDLSSMGVKGSALHVRESSVSLAFVQVLQASLGMNGDVAALLGARLLGKYLLLACKRRLNTISQTVLCA